MTFGFNPFATTAFSDLGETSVSIAVDINGFSLSATLGNETTEANGTVTLTGFSLSAILGNETIEADGTVTLTGLPLTTNLNNVAFQIDSNVTVVGEELQKVLESFAGVEASGNISVPVFENPMSINLGNAIEEITQDVFPTGLEANLNLNSVSAESIAEVTLTGFGITTEINSVGISAEGNISVPVFESPLNIQLENIFIEADGQVEILGQEMISTLGNETIAFDSSVSLTGFGLSIVENSVGIEASGNISIPVFENPMSINLGNTNETGTGEVSLTGEELTNALNSVTVDILKEVDVVGAEATIFLNDVTFKIDSTVLLNGFSLNTGLGSINNSYGWNIVNTGTSVNYLNVTPVFLPPSDTYSQLATFNAPSLTDRTSDFVFAIDVQGFDATDYGVLYEYGGAAFGHAISLEAGGQLYAGAFNSGSWQAAGQAYLQVDVSPYYNTAGTFYTTMNDSTGTFKLYFQPGGSNSGNQVVLLGTSTIGDTTNNWAGANPCGIGTVNGASMVNFGFTNYNANFTGTINQFRAWYQTSATVPFHGIAPSASWNTVDTGTSVVYTEVAA